MLLKQSDPEELGYGLWEERAAGAPLLLGPRPASSHVKGILPKGQLSLLYSLHGGLGQSLITCIFLACLLCILFVCLFPSRT